MPSPEITKQAPLNESGTVTILIYLPPRFLNFNVSIFYKIRHTYSLGLFFKE
jgi:hypothetical protein